jgi:hypothetical protein
MDPLPSLAEKGVVNNVTATNDQQKERIPRAIYPTARLKQNIEEPYGITRSAPAQRSGQDRIVEEWVDQASRLATNPAPSQGSLVSDKEVKGNKLEDSRAPSPLSRKSDSIVQFRELRHLDMEAP